MTDKSKEKIENDAKGQFAPVQSGGKNNGVASAKPRVITGSDDATVHKWPPGVDNPPEDWHADFEQREEPVRKPENPAQGQDKG
tara:strand:- start:3698 stop:3949 length:252 start_codon:yes stop_codon:yes gene_type:complete